MKFRINSGYYTLIPLVIWGGAILGFGLIRFNSFGIHEGAAKDLILLWSIVDRVASPVGTFGAPDFRAFLLLPVSLYWPGSIIAAKIFTILIMFATTTLFYMWACKQNKEAATIASALLLILPLTITQIDEIGVGPYLLLAFTLAHWANNAYRAKGHLLGGWYFTQLAIIALAVSLHPAGLAYPLVLCWFWYKNAETTKRKAIFIGTAIITTFTIIFRLGWHDDMVWFSNPFTTLGNALLNDMPGTVGNTNLVIGLIVAALLLVVIYRDRHTLLSDFMNYLLTFGIVLGLFAADETWAMLALTFLLYRGTIQLLEDNKPINSQNLIGQRGVIMVAIFVLATFFMIIDKSYARSISLGVLAPRDALIQSLCDIAPDPESETGFKIASQWPARTMIACKHVAFPLPKAEENSDAFLAKIKGITHLIFDHNDPVNQALARNIAEQSGATETLIIQQSGVIIGIRDQTNNP